MTQINVEADTQKQALTSYIRACFSKDIDRHQPRVYGAIPKNLNSDRFLGHVFSVIIIIIVQLDSLNIKILMRRRSFV